MRGALFENHGEHVAVDAGLHQQWAWKVGVDREAKEVILVHAEGFSQQASPERSRLASPFELNNLPAD
jgi:hypothetical protein